MAAGGPHVCCFPLKNLAALRQQLLSFPDVANMMELLREREGRPKRQHSTKPFGDRSNASLVASLASFMLVLGIVLEAFG